MATTAPIQISPFPEPGNVFDIKNDPIVNVDSVSEGSSSDNDQEEYHHKSFVTTLSEVPVTQERPPFVPSAAQPLPYGGVPRANYAPDVEHPDGTTEREWRKRHADKTVLQQHLAFFDPDGDGIVSIMDTFNACRRMGWNLFFSIFATFIIHTSFAYGTCPSFIPDPQLRIYINNIHRTKHGSDTGAYDYEGRFVPQHFEDFWAKWGKDYDGKGLGVTKWDIRDAILGQRMLNDFFGPVAEVVEWTMTYVTIWPEDGVLRKDDVRRVYDGSIFEVVAERHRLKQLEKQKADKQQ